MRVAGVKLLLTATAVALAAAATTAEAPPAPTRADYKKATTSLKEIGLAFHKFESANSHFPGNIEGKDGKALLSWRVAILPDIDEEKLYKEFKLDEPWDSAHNTKLIAKMPKIYAPIRVKAKPGETFYQMFSGPGTLLEPKKKATIARITDGTSNTGLVFEAGEPVVWTKPADMPFDPKKPLPKLGGLFEGQCHAVMCDGSVIRLKKDPDEEELKKLIQPADGNVIDLDKLTK